MKEIKTEKEDTENENYSCYYYLLRRVLVGFIYSLFVM